MQDRQNARLMGMKPTGNGRRESFAHVPMPRMTNTYMLAGTRDPQEIIASVKNGIYAVNFGGGQVDITSGKYVFECTEAYRIENGKRGAPIKGAMLIGNGPTDLNRISMVGNDLALDDGIGTCGKNGQGVPVGVGQPTLRHRPHHGRRHGLTSNSADAKGSPCSAGSSRSSIWPSCCLCSWRQRLRSPNLITCRPARWSRRCRSATNCWPPNIPTVTARRRCRRSSRSRRPNACSPRCRTAATSWCSAGRAIGRRSGSSGSSDYPEIASRCGTGGCGSTASRSRSRQTASVRPKPKTARCSRVARFIETLPGDRSHTIFKHDGLGAL